MWQPIYHGVKVEKLVTLLQVVGAHCPEAVLMPNKVGHLAIVRPDKEEGWLFVGYVDMDNENVHWLPEDLVTPFDPRACHPMTAPLPL